MISNKVNNCSIHILDLRAFQMGYLRDKTFEMGLSNASILHGIFRLKCLVEFRACLSPKVIDKKENNSNWTIPIKKLPITPAIALLFKGR